MWAWVKTQNLSPKHFGHDHQILWGDSSDIYSLFGFDNLNSTFSHSPKHHILPLTVKNPSKSHQTSANPHQKTSISRSKPHQKIVDQNPIFIAKLPGFPTRHPMAGRPPWPCCLQAPSSSGACAPGRSAAWWPDPRGAARSTWCWSFFHWRYPHGLEPNMGSMFSMTKR